MFSASGTNPVTGTRTPASPQRRHHGDDRAARGHVGLHRHHRLARLEREAAGVERDALAHEHDVRVRRGAPHRGGTAARPAAGGGSSRRRRRRCRRSPPARAASRRGRSPRARAGARGRGPAGPARPGPSVPAACSPGRGTGAPCDRSRGPARPRRAPRPGCGPGRCRSTARTGQLPGVAARARGAEAVGRRAAAPRRGPAPTRRPGPGPCRSPRARHRSAGAPGRPPPDAARSATPSPTPTSSTRRTASSARVTGTSTTSPAPARRGGPLERGRQVEPEAGGPLGHRSGDRGPVVDQPYGRREDRRVGGLQAGVSDREAGWCHGTCSSPDGSGPGPQGARVGAGRRGDALGQPIAVFRASPSAPASSADSSTTSRPPPSSGTRMTMPRPSLVTSSGPSPVRGFMAAMLAPFAEKHASCGASTGMNRSARDTSTRRVCSGIIPRNPRPRETTRPGTGRETGRPHRRERPFGPVRPVRRPPALPRRPGARSPRWCGCSRRSGVAAPAVRTAVSRMVRQGWLEPVRLAGGPGYALTRGPCGASTTPRRASTGPAARAGRGRWHLVVVTAADRAQPARPAARRPGLPRLRPARRRDLDRPALVGGGRRAAGGRGGAGRAVHRAPRRRLARPGAPRLGHRGPGPRLHAVAGRRRAARDPGRAATPTTSRRSRPGPGSSTSGASSCSWTRACRGRCCPPTGRATRRPSSSTPRASA